MKHHPNRVGQVDRKRLLIVAFTIFSMLSFLVFQFFKLQILEGKKWEKKALLQHQFFVKEPYKRGVFYTEARYRDLKDRYQPLVIDIPMFHLYLDSDAIPKDLKPKLSSEISKLLKASKSKEDFIQAQFDKKSRSRKLAMWLSKRKKELIESWWYGVAREHKLPKNAIYFVSDFKRSYPSGKMLGQVIQTIRDDRDAKTNQAIPTGGLELYFNQALQGIDGRRRLLRSPKYPMDRGDLVKKPLHGADVYLTIDHYIQAIAEEEIAKAVKIADAKSGWAVIMDPNSGDILALAQYPFFYPAEYRRYYSDPKLIQQTKVKAITDCFEPGSILKAISLCISLQANQKAVDQGRRPLFDPEAKFRLRSVKFPGRKKPIRDVAKSEYLNLNLAMQKSSNIYISHLVQKAVDTFGDKWYKTQLEEIFGFGRRTGVELPSESPGFVPTPGKTYANGKLQWSVPTPGCLAIGYNLMVNSLHLLKAYAILANGGYDIKPTLLKKIVRNAPDGSEEILYEKPKDIKRKQVLSDGITDRVISAIKFVTKPGGTAFRADVPGFTEAGKTSTTEKIQKGIYADKVHISSFLGFTPAKKPKIVVMIGIDEPAYRFLPGIGKTHYGGKCAAPVFREIAKKVLAYMGEVPDDPYGYQVGDPRRDEDKADMIQEVADLRNLFIKWHKPK